MDKLNQTLMEMDFDFLGAGKHSMNVEMMKTALLDDHFFFLDVRTDQELEYLRLPFATHIPMHELPERLDELPEEKCIVPFCSAIFRAGVVYTYLRVNGFEEVKCLTATSEDIAAVLKPGPLAKILA